MRLRRAVLSLAVTMLTISPSTSWAGPSQSTFATKADALFRDVQRKVGGAGTPTTRAELIAYLRKEQRVTTPALAKLKFFALPTKHHSEANRVVRLTASDLKALGHYIDALKAGGTGKSYSDTLDKTARPRTSSGRLSAPLTASADGRGPNVAHAAHPRSKNFVSIVVRGREPVAPQSCARASPRRPGSPVTR